MIQPHILDLFSIPSRKPGALVQFPLLQRDDRPLVRRDRRLVLSLGLPKGLLFGSQPLFALAEPLFPFDQGSFAVVERLLTLVELAGAVGGDGSTIRCGRRQVAGLTIDGPRGL